MKRFVLGLSVLAVFCSMLFSLPMIVAVDASETIYIRADGSVDPSTAPISTVDDVTYIFTDHLHEPGGIVVERSNIIIDGKGYTLQGSGEDSAESGLSFYDINNVTIQNLIIKDFYYGFRLKSSSFDTVSDNNITSNQFGIKLEESSNHNSIYGNNIVENDQCGILIITSSSFNIISGNDISKGAHANGVNLWAYSDHNSIYANNIMANAFYGVELYNSSSNSVYENNVTANSAGGILLRYSSNNNSLFRNNIANNGIGISLSYSSGNSIYGNNLTANDNYGVSLASSSDNKFYHNNFNNTNQVYDSSWGSFVFSPSINAWDDGYPSRGNYWSDYSGKDANADGIGDTPYVIDGNNLDRYPIVRLNDIGSGLPVDPNIFYTMIIVVIAIVAAVALFVTRRRKKASEEVALSQSWTQHSRHVTNYSEYSLLHTTYK